MSAKKKTMKLKNRLLTAFLITMLLPVVLISLVFTALIHIQNGVFQKVYHLDNTSAIQIVQSPVKILDRETRDLFGEICVQCMTDTSALEDAEYLHRIETQAEEKYSFVVVRKEAVYTFIGQEESYANLEDSLPDYTGDNEANSTNRLLGNNNSYLVKQRDFIFPDGSLGSVFLVTDTNTMLPQIRSLVIQLCVSILVILCFTAVLLTYWIYQSILRPLNKLRLATNAMRQGNLDYAIEPESQDEIGLLTEDFEKMRVRLKATMEMQVASEENTRELVGNISHDLKTPLTAIKGYTEGLIDGIADTKERREKYLRTIYSKANDMTYLVDELSDFNKIDSGNMVYHFVELNVDRFFMDCIQEYSLDLEEKNVAIGYYNYLPKDLTMRADPEQLKRVLNNIIGNSIKYMDKPKGMIDVRLRNAEEGFLEVQVEDNGKGIPSEELSVIFERFYRTDASRNSSQGGSGLGLSIAKKIIGDHGGKIWAEGKEGVGTTICFTLLKWKNSLPEAKDELMEPERPPRKKIHLLTHPFRKEN